jgi:signal transduction histidine kinase
MSQSQALWKSRPSANLSYGVAVLSVAAALVFATLMQTYLQTEPFVSSFLCAIMFAAWFGGAGPGLLAAVLAVLAFIYYAAAPSHSFVVAPTEIPRVVLFAIAAVFVVWLSSAQRAATDSLRRARDELQAALEELAGLNKTLQVENAERKRAEEQLRQTERELRLTIEDQKRAEGALRRSEAYLAEAQRLSRTGSFGRGMTSGEIVWSKELYRILEIDEAVRPTVELILQRVHPDDRELVRHEVNNVERDEHDCDYEFRLLAPSGAIKHLHVRAHRVSYESGGEEIIGALMDVTAIKEAQEALQTAQAELAHVARVTALGEMSASIAHEVNQPLSAIVVNGEASLRWLTREVPDMDQALAAIRRIVGDANRASGVVGRIRELARKADREVIQLGINEVIGETVPLVKRETLSHRVRLELQLAPGLPTVRGDRIQLQQVIINLVINAVQAMATVTDRARVVVIRTQPHESDQVLVAVEDVGTGMAPESLNRLFSAFYTTKPDGLGMGLSICRSIIEAHGGRVWASPNIGPGMTFQFTISGYDSAPTSLQQV